VCLEDGISEDGISEDGISEDGISEDESPEYGSPENGSLEDGSPEVGSPQDGSIEDGSKEDTEEENSRDEAAKQIGDKTRIYNSLLACSNTKEVTDSGYETTSVIVKGRAESPVDATIETLIDAQCASVTSVVSVAVRLGRLGAHKAPDVVGRKTAKEKRNERRLKIKRTEDRYMSQYTNFSNLVDTRSRLKKARNEIITLKSIRAMVIPSPSKRSTKEKLIYFLQDQAETDTKLLSMRTGMRREKTTVAHR
jgi:hypothetical protein